MNFKENITSYITGKVEKGQRHFKLVDGTKALNKSRVFFEGEIKNLGNSTKAYKNMQKLVDTKLEDWYSNNKALVDQFYTSDPLNNFIKVG